MSSELCMKAWIAQIAYSSGAGLLVRKRGCGNGQAPEKESASARTNSTTTVPFLLEEHKVGGILSAFEWLFSKLFRFRLKPLS